jgi:hypothetical protein
MLPRHRRISEILLCSKTHRAAFGEIAYQSSKSALSRPGQRAINSRGGGTETIHPDAAPIFSTLEIDGPQA